MVKSCAIFIIKFQLNGKGICSGGKALAAYPKGWRLNPARSWDFFLRLFKP